MTISGVSAQPQLPNPAAAAASANAKSADGDFKARNPQSAATKDSDGDYKPIAAPIHAAATSSQTTQATLTSLAKGGQAA